MRTAIVLAFALVSLLSHARLPDLIPYRKGNLWGYCDSTKRMIIEPQWEFSSPFQGATAVVKKNGFYGLIDRTGKATTSFIYTALEQDSRNGKRIAASGKKRKNVGLIDEKGGVVIPFEYSRMYWETDKYLRVYDGVLCGEMDSTGKTIVPFDYVSTYPEQGFIFGESAKCGYFVFSNGSGRKFGVIDSTARVVIPLIYDDVFDVGNGYFSMGKSTPDSTYNWTEYLFDRNGRPANWDEVPNSFSVAHIRFFPCPARDSAMNLYYTGWATDMYYREMAYEEKLLYAGGFHLGLARFMTLDSLCGFKNEKFENVIAPKYGFCSDFYSNSLAEVYALHHKYPKKRSWKEKRADHFDVVRRQQLGYIDIYGNEYWED